ncbi:MAG: alanine racemase [Acidobacteria bacterium]|nr:alanine racemase [Acidobacteriota bacterium]MBI3657209.1 alanine racemase [Acidobacteriota bacterium]
MKDDKAATVTEAPVIPAPASLTRHSSPFILHPSGIPGRPTVAYVDLNRLEKNYAALRTFLDKSVRVLGVVKADAYGHGSLPIAHRLERLGIDALGVGTVSGGVELRASGIQCPILVLGGFWRGEEESIVRHGLTPTIYRLEQLYRLSEVAGGLSARLKYHLKMDTGMTRLGVDYTQIVEFARTAQSIPHLHWEGLYSHLSSADENDPSFTRRQIERFLWAVQELASAGFEVPVKHLANSAGLINYPEAWYDMVRPGLSLLGLLPKYCRAPLDVSPILTLRTQIMSLRRVATQTPLSYGRRFVTSREGTIATLPIGYADGLSRLMSNKGAVIVRDQLAPIVGSVTMDMTLIDVTDIPHVQINDDALIIGQSARHSITAETIADQIQTIPYEVFCAVSKRVPRHYLG